MPHVRPVPALPELQPPRRLSAAEVMASEVPERHPILDPVLSAASLTLLYGPRGTGKTFVALSIAWAAASGSSFLGWQAPRRHRVLYVDGEMSAAEMKQRLGRLGPTPDDLHFMLAGLDERDFLDLASFEGQRELCEHWGRMPELLVLDNLSSLVGYSTNDPDAWTDFQRWLLDLRRAGVAVLILHHANKKGMQRGTSRREDVLDMVLAMRRPAGYAPSEGARFELHFEKARGVAGDAVEPIEARLQFDADGRIAWDWGKVEDMELRRVAALLRDGWKPYQIARELGMSKAKAYRLRDQTNAYPRA